jgi:hypothetical protein
MFWDKLEDHRHNYEYNDQNNNKSIDILKVAESSYI